MKVDLENIAIIQLKILGQDDNYIEQMRNKIYSCINYYDYLYSKIDMLKFRHFKLKNILNVIDRNDKLNDSYYLISFYKNNINNILKTKYIDLIIWDLEKIGEYINDNFNEIGSNR